MRSIAIVGIVVCVASIARANDAAEVGRLVDGQLDNLFEAKNNAKYYAQGTVVARIDDFTAAAMAASLADNLKLPTAGFITVAQRDRKVAIARDGRSAWVSLVVQLTTRYERAGDALTDDWRVSELLAKTDAGWRVVATAWTQAVPDADANRAAQAGKLGKLATQEGPGDDSVRAAVAALAKSGFAKPEAVAKELVVFGSAPGERTTSGPTFAKAWNAAWLKHVAFGGVAVFSAESGTTAIAITDATLHKRKGSAAYDIPFRLVLIFDKDAAGTWQLVHAHFAVPQA